ncbi:penicillin acylase family protein [Aquihabitans daechungensis]|uniref:penicillin acylase family protein n=1 Tax=Aquihabitans daechungensis TaxID=1052257 RepID=UPI003BA34106
MTQGDRTYEADIRWTTHGVAHIRGAGWGDLGFGQGYACARDHLPTLADQIVKVRSERARFHGAGPDGAHVGSDLGYRALGVVQRAPQLRDAQPDRIRHLVSGYTAGYNAWLAEALETDALPAWCSGAEWVRPIDELDLWTYYVDIGLLASGRNLAEIIGRAEAPGPEGPAAPSPVSALGGGAGASNGWAFGGDATASGHGLVVANPHFPWGGEARFWECHVTVPGELDAYGVALIGAPGVQMGFNADIAWAHTFSRGHRFTLAKLDLVPGAPTSYRYGDEERAMTSHDETIEVLGDDGTVTPLTRTLWRSHHGPMVNLPLLGWGLEQGFTYRDANLDNDHVMAQFLGMCQATGMDEFQAVFADVQGMPWVNTLAADRTGRAWFIDASATPNLSPEAIERFHDRIQNDLIAGVLFESRVALLDGSDPGDEWQDDPAARSPGLLPYERFPQIENRDYVVNANDSHWLNHAATRLEGFSPLHGLEGTARTLRTRQNLLTAQRLAAAGDLTIDGAIAAVLSNESLSAELLCDDVIARARAAGPVTDQGVEIDLAPAADVLAAWDRRCDLDSIGASLWREFMAGFDSKQMQAAGPLFAVDFDPAAPVTTPHELAPPDDLAGDTIVAALATAVRLLDQAGVALDAPLGDVQWAQRGEHRVPVHGGYEGDGVLNILAPFGALNSLSLEPPAPLPPVAPERTMTSGIATGGYRTTYGTSFLMAVELTDAGPNGTGLLAYGQSGDARSPHHLDGTEAYAAKATRPLLFTDEAIDADPNLIHRTLRI